MTQHTSYSIDLGGVAKLVDAVDETFGRILQAALQATQGGKRIDESQVCCERLACLATEIAAMKSLLSHARMRAQTRDRDALIEQMAGIFAAEVSDRLICNTKLFVDGFGLSEQLLTRRFRAARIQDIMRAGLMQERAIAVGRHIARNAVTHYSWARNKRDAKLRHDVRKFAEDEVKPIAERLHRRNELVPEIIIHRMGKMGLFGLTVPSVYGGCGAGKVEMVIATEELSRQSMASVGSMLTRSEILVESLLKGGTEGQQKEWLPKIAAGKLMVGLSVTEPLVGSDVSSCGFRAQANKQTSNRGYLLTGDKSWCTFAGRANVLALLARTDPDLRRGTHGLSLFIVEKRPFRGRCFDICQPGGGRLSGVAEPTPGYRGLFSFNLKINNYFVPTENLVGGPEGLGRGFYLQMQGFSIGRLQTAARATGLALAALECAAAYASNRRQFGQPIANFQLTQYKLGRMATQVMAAQRLTHAAATAMDNGDLNILMPTMAKLFASNVAVRVAKDGQLIHGGWGYSEKYPISRHVVDAQVLPLFEGVNSVLALKVIARKMLG